MCTYVYYISNCDDVGEKEGESQVRIARCGRRNECVGAKKINLYHSKKSRQNQQRNAAGEDSKMIER